MKIFRILVCVFTAFFMFSCSSDDDICTSGEATPRMKIKFKDSNQKLIRLDSLYVDVDYGNGAVNVLKAKAIDSVLIPLRVDDTGFTEFSIRKTAKGSKSTIKVNYTSESQYVSPACGIKKLYQNVTSELKTATPVTSLEQTQTQIINESKTHLYLIF